MNTWKYAGRAGKKRKGSVDALHTTFLILVNKNVNQPKKSLWLLQFPFFVCRGTEKLQSSWILNTASNPKRHTNQITVPRLYIHLFTLKPLICYHICFQA